MTEVLVQIRVPKKLLDDLKQSPSFSHYLDQSELIRSLVREEWIQKTNPELFEIKKLREDIAHELKEKSAVKVKQEMVHELEILALYSHLAKL